jgi:hypothetical protein
MVVSWNTAMWCAGSLGEMIFFILRPVKLLFYTVVYYYANPYFISRRWHPPRERGHDPRTAQIDLANEFANRRIDSAIQRIRFQAQMSSVSLNERQQKTMKKLLDAGPKGFEGGMTTRKHERIAQTSTPTAARDLIELERLGLLIRYGDGRSTRYYPAIEGWAEDDAKVGKASVEAGMILRVIFK